MIFFVNKYKIFYLITQMYQLLARYKIFMGFPSLIILNSKNMKIFVDYLNFKR